MVEINPELYKTRNFIGRTEPQRRDLESQLKKRYEVSDWVDKRIFEDDEKESGLGYRIHDRKTGEDSYFSANARLTLETRYLEKDSQRNASENVLDLFTRVAGNIAEADLKYDTDVDVVPIAEGFLDLMIKQQFMPNTPTLCNAGRSLQQLAACFVLPVADYMATDDLGEDPEKQGEGIFDTQRYMAMVHKSGGGTGFFFGNLRPRSDRISTTFGSSSGPVSFIKVYDAATGAVNQGGFRRGANMGILQYDHPDIFEFVSEKARNQNLTNFNLSIGTTDGFMKSVERDEYFPLVNPKDQDKKSREERFWRKDNMLSKGEDNYNKLFGELTPSLIIGEDGKSVINVYKDCIVGRVGEDGEILISARALFDYAAECAWEDGCPGLINLEKLERNNRTPHMGRIIATNPCGEQPLLDNEACNLGGINLGNCVIDQKIDYEELDRRIDMGTHFLDNVIDMSKYPFQKVYGAVHATRKIGLGLMGWAEMLGQLDLRYDSREARDLAAHLSSYITEKAIVKSEELAGKRGVFPAWEGSFDDRQGRRTRNATRTTIAPNGTTGMICDVNGGAEPFFKAAYSKTCMDGKVLEYWAKGLIKDLEAVAEGDELRDILLEVQRTGSVQHIKGIPDKIKNKYLTAHDISPEDHIRMQAAFQNGENGAGIENAVSKTVNLPYDATVEDVKRLYMLSWKEGCVGTTIFRDRSKKGVYGSLEQKVDKGVPQLVQNNVVIPKILDVKAQAFKTRVKRRVNEDSLHMTFASELYVNNESKKAYFIPTELFQERAPLGHSTSVSFSQSGMDRTEILQGPDPNYAEFVTRLQSASSNEEEGLGPSRIKSIEHALGVAAEYVLLTNGIIGRDDQTHKLVNLIRKKDLKKVETGSEEYDEILKQVRVRGSDEKLEVSGNHGKLGKRFECEFCQCTEFVMEAGCHSPKCANCGEIEGGGCG